MYTINSLNEYFNRRPQFAHLRASIMEAAMRKADADGYIVVANGDWSWMDQFLFTDFQQECARDPLGMFKLDMPNDDVGKPFLW